MPNTVTVKKEELLAALQENRATHRDIFEEAVDGWRTKAIELLEQRVEEVRKGKMLTVLVQLPVPEDHTADYDRAIRMVTMEVSDEIELDEREFSELVMDDWGWKRQWVQTASAYTVMEK